MIISTLLPTIILIILFISIYISYFIYMKKKAKSYLVNDNNYITSVSTIIPTYNEELTINKKLKNIFEQDYPNNLLELIIIDSASTDNTLKLIKKNTENKLFNIKIISEKERRGKALALTTAFEYCNNDIVVITDSDALWEKNALKKAISNFSNKKIGAVTGRQILINPKQNLATKSEKEYRNIYETLRIGESVLDSTPIFHGEMSCYRRKLIPHLSEKTIADDSEMAIKIRKKGYKSIYDPNVCFFEYAPPSFRASFIQKIKRGQGLIQLFLQEKDLIFNNRYGYFGKIIFPAEFFMNVLSPVMLTLLIISVIINIILLSDYYMYFLIILIIFVLIPSIIKLIFPNKLGLIDIFVSFINLQFILLIGLIYHLCGVKQHKWKKVDEIRDLWE